MQFFLPQVVDSGPTPPSVNCSRDPPTTSFHIYDESQSAAALPNDQSYESVQRLKELEDDVFLRPDERGLSLKIQCSRPGGCGLSLGLDQMKTIYPGWFTFQSLSLFCLSGVLSESFQVCFHFNLSTMNVLLCYVWNYIMMLLISSKGVNK